MKVIHDLGCRRLLASIILILAAWTFLSTGGSAQIRARGQFPGNNSQNQVSDLFRPAPRAFQQQLRRAEKAIAEEDYRSAVVLLGAVLTGQTPDPDLAEIQQDYFVTGDGETKHRTSIRAEALRLLGAMPAEGRQWYELKFGTEAAQIMKRAVAEGDLGALHDVTRKYFHTQAGYDAALLVGRRQLDRGHPLAAALSLKRLYDAPHARSHYEPTLSLLLAASWLRAGVAEQATDVIVRLRQSSKDSGVVLGGQRIDWFTDASTAPEWLKQNLHQTGVELHQRERQWVVFRGNAQRNGVTDGGFPLMHFRWRVASVIDPSDAEIVANQRAAFESEGRAAIPMFQPLAVGDLIVMRTPERVFGVDLKTGKRIWDYPWFQDVVAAGLTEKSGFSAHSNRSQRMDELRQRIWEDAPYGQLSSDGERVFLLAEMGFAARSGVNRAAWINPAQPNSKPQAPQRTNQLVACSIEEEGKLQWIVGGVTGEDEPDLAGGFFLGPPLPLMGQLFVLAELNGEIRLLALDATNGELLWFQQIAHVAELTIDRDTHRRLSGATPSFDDGILVCPTSAGACVGVDLATRSLLWGYQYSAFRPTVNRYRTTTSFPNLGDRWVDGSATVAQGAVVLTPVEASQLHCLDLLSGRPRWSPIERDGMLFVGGVFDGLIFLVGTERCRAIRLSDGKREWDEDIELGSARPSGRGFLTGQFYYLPTTSAELLKIDIKTGQVVQTTKTDQPLGNLVSYNNQIISDHVDWLACYYQAEPLRRLVESRLKDNSDDIWALLRQSELLLHDRKRTEALITLRRAHKLSPNDELAKTLLVNTLMEALRNDFTGHRDIATEVESLIDHPRQRLDFLRLMVNGSLNQKEWDVAWRSLKELISASEGRAETTLLGQLSVTLRPETGHRVRFDRWLAARVGEFYQNSEDRHRQILSDSLAERLADRRSDPLRLRQLLVIYGAIPAADEVRLALARLLVREGESLVEAELLISSLVDSSAIASNALRAQSLALEAEILQKVGRYREAMRYVLELGQSYPDVELPDGKLAGEWVGEQLQAMESRQASATNWPKGVVKSNESRDVHLQTSYVYAFRNAQMSGAVDPGTQVSYEISRRVLRVRDAFGNPQVSLNLGTYFNTSGPWPHAVHQRGHMILASVGFEVLMINTLAATQATESGEELRWRKDISTVLGNNQQRFRTMRTSIVQGKWGGQRFRPVDQATGTALGAAGPFLSQGAVYQKLGEIVCVDPLNGEILWSRGGFEPGAELIGNQDRLIVIEPNSEEAIVLRIWDGKEIGRRPVPPINERWSDWRGHLLTCRVEKGQRIVTLRDVWAGKTIWERKLSDKTLLSLVAHDEFATAEPDGKISVLRIADGSVSATVAGNPILYQSELFVLKSSRDYLVAVSGETASQGSLQFMTPIPWRCPLISGHIYALDRATGKSRWPRPAAIAGYALPLDQPAESPVLLLMRRTQNKSALRSPGPSTRSSVLCLDRRYGNIILEEKFLPRTPTNFELVSDTTEAEVTLRVPQFRFTFKFTDEEFEKAPLPVEMDLKSMLKVSEAIEGMGRMAADLLKGLGGAKPNIGPKPKDPPKDDPPEEDAPADDPKKDVNPFEKKPPVKNLPKTSTKKKDG